jgi:hypothetical protein
MPDQSSAADEHALIQEIAAPLAGLPADPVLLTSHPDFPVVLRGYDRMAVDAYVRRTTELVAELQAARSPEAAVRRALEQVGEQISGILQRAHETAAEITTQSRSEAEDRLEVARQEAERILTESQARLRELDVDADRVWGERQRIIDDARALGLELQAMADSAAERFPAAASETGEHPAEPPAAVDEHPAPAPASVPEAPADPASDPDATVAMAPVEFDPTAEP